jgi:hypothetical protein
MAAVSTMVLNSLIANGEKAIGDTLTANEQAYYLSKLNSMMESWSLERLMCYQIKQESFSLTASTASYTIGSGATFSTDRPTKIDSAFVRDASNLDSRVEVVPYDAYDSIVQKDSGNTYPSHLFYDQGYDASGFGTIKLYPAPSASLTLYINSWKQLQTFAAMSTALLLPPGYQRAIESNFTIETAPGLKSVPPEVVKIAKEAKAAIKGVNLPEAVSRMPTGIVHRSTGNIIEGR